MTKLKAMVSLSKRERLVALVESVFPKTQVWLLQEGRWGSIKQVLREHSR